MMMMFILALILCTLFWMISFLSNKSMNFKNKFYSFECGFNPFTSPQSFFSIQFFKILMIFLLFDMEIIIIMPIPLYHPMTFMNYTFYILIMSMIILGLMFEWKEGSLEWLK
uniref:NADH-ubiquinone oxidoreductase chain 3 n=1 Tax=Phytoseiulus persimilis TaxID=44414 RepID=D5HKW3_PHYPM|nr:NADH dehydrogenase subunit 3 [Phytoseiulus persimilis]